jgi:hypothetical protein
MDTKTKQPQGAHVKQRQKQEAWQKQPERTYDNALFS